jgi:hypothetical protein
LIVRREGDALVLVTQPDHARLAGALMERCVTLQRRPRRAAILRAIASHDDGWLAVDAVPALDPATGAVVDFVTAPAHIRQGVWPRAIAGLDDDPWAAALVAQHALTVYARFRPDAEWQAFFADLESRRDALLARCGRSLAALEPDYPFVRLGDLVSLVFCTASREPQRYGEWTVSIAGTRVEVTPDPFGGAEVPLTVAARRLPGGAFRSQAELGAAWERAPRLTLSGSVGAARPG